MQLIKPIKCGTATVTGVRHSFFDRVEVKSAQSLVTCIANTAIVDMDDEVVVPDGAPPLGKAYFDKARTIYLNHDYDRAIGSMRWRKLADGAWRVQMHISQKTDLGRDTLALIEDGVIRGTSIGFAARDRSEPTDEEIELYGMCSVVTREWDWIEHSVTPMPCNPGAMIQPLDEDKSARVEALIRKGRVTRETARVIGLSDRKVFAVGSPVLQVDPRPVLRV